MNDQFYIGWEDKAAPGLRGFVRLAVLGLLILAIGAALVLAAAQHVTSASIFEWGEIKKFAGILEMEPYPHLLVPRPGEAGGQQGFSTYYLVAPFKHGLDRARFAGLDGKSVSLEGTLIYRASQTMVEAVPDSIKAVDKPIPALGGEETVGLGLQTLEGEIVDSKCFLGVMNPGQLLPHRACAIRCIAGGIPPILLVRQKSGLPVYLLLVSDDGKAVNQQVLDMVAEPVKITGEVERQGDLLILRADPGTYQRLSRQSL
jgi:hypothetical protein